MGIRATTTSKESQRSAWRTELLVLVTQGVMGSRPRSDNWQGYPHPMHPLHPDLEKVKSGWQSMIIVRAASASANRQHYTWVPKTQHALR